MRSGSHVQLAALRNRDLSYRQPRHLVIMDQWNGQQRAFAIKNVLVLLGFQKFPFFCVTLYLKKVHKILFVSQKLQKKKKIGQAQILRLCEADKFNKTRSTTTHSKFFKQTRHTLITPRNVHGAESFLRS